MKKIITIAITIIMALGLTSCGTERSITKRVTAGMNTVYVTERKGDEIVKEYEIVFDNPQDAWKEVHG